jgi:hypothetical protein
MTEQGQDRRTVHFSGGSEAAEGKEVFLDGTRAVAAAKTATGTTTTASSSSSTTSSSAAPSSSTSSDPPPSTKPRVSAWDRMRQEHRRSAAAKTFLTTMDGGRASSQQIFKALLDPVGEKPKTGLEALSVESSRVLAATTLAASVEAGRHSQIMNERQLSEASLQDKRTLARVRALSQRLLIDPRTSRFIGKWDTFTVLALAFTALFTPYEVAFLGAPESYADAIFVGNRIVDIIFILDGILQFFLIVSVSDKHGDRWITDHSVLVQRYLRGWFIIDAFSVGISSVDFLLVESKRSVGSEGGMSAANEQTLSRFKVLRVVRVLRLLKLLRIARTSRLVARWETKVRLNYGALSLVRMLIVLMLCVHWGACAWMLGASFTWPTPEETWLYNAGNIYCLNTTEVGWSDGINLAYAERYYTDPPQGDTAPGWKCVHPLRIYCAATYWSAMTITSIGYGDIAATPGNSAEQFIATVLMLGGAMLWGQVVATFCSVVGSMGAAALKFRMTLDHLNDFMAREKLPQRMQWRLREFFFRTKHLRNHSANVALLSEMSPRLKGETLWLTNKTWLHRVSFLVGTEPEFIATMVLALNPVVFTPEDEIYGNEELYVLHRGVALYGGRVLNAGSVWGEDMLLECDALRSRWSAKALSYLETNKIGRERLYSVAAGFPRTWKILRRSSRCLAPT